MLITQLSSLPSRDRYLFCYYHTTHSTNNSVIIAEGGKTIETIGWCYPDNTYFINFELEFVC